MHGHQRAAGGAGQGAAVAGKGAEGRRLPGLPAVVALHPPHVGLGPGPPVADHRVVGYLGQADLGEVARGEPLARLRTVVLVAPDGCLPRLPVVGAAEDVVRRELRVQVGADLPLAIYGQQQGSVAQAQDLPGGIGRQRQLRGPLAHDLERPGLSPGAALVRRLVRVERILRGCLLVPDMHADPRAVLSNERCAKALLQSRRLRLRPGPAAVAGADPHRSANLAVAGVAERDARGQFSGPALDDVGVALERLRVCFRAGRDPVRGRRGPVLCCVIELKHVNPIRMQILQMLVDLLLHTDRDLIWRQIRCGYELSS